MLNEGKVPSRVDNSHDDRVLSYSSGLAKGYRFSKLAAISPIVSIISCPWGLGIIFKSVSKWLNGHFDERTVDHIARLIPASLLIASVCLPLVAIVRINRARGKLKGLIFAIPSLLISLSWWLLMIGGYFIMRFSGFE
jgi:hypothetical protein